MQIRKNHGAPPAAAGKKGAPPAAAGKKGIHYGWIITLGCGMVVFYTVGLAFNCISLYLNPLMEVLAINNTLRSSMTMFYQTGSVAALLVVGKVIDKIGSRKSILFFSLLMASGYVLLGVTTSLTLAYAGMLIVGVGYGLCGLVPVTYLLTDWFDDKRGLAIGIAMCGSGVATLFAPTLVNFIIGTLGVKAAFFVQAATIAVFAILSFAILKDKPEDMGLKPYGRKASICEVTTNDRSSGRSSGECEKEHETKFFAALGDRNFLLLSVALLLMGCMISPFIQHLSPVISQSGYSQSTAAAVVSTYGIIMIIGKPVFGTMMDRLGVVKTNTYAFTLLAAATVSGILLDGSSLCAFAIPVCMGLGSAPLATVALPVWTATLFGKKGVGNLFAMLKMIYTIGGIIGASIPGIIFDRAGNYAGLFKIYLVITVIVYCTLTFIFINKERRPQAAP